MAKTKEVSSLETISGNSASLLGKTPSGNVGFISGLLGADGKVVGIPDISGLATTESVNQQISEVETRLQALEKESKIDITFNKDSENAQSGKAVEDAFKQHQTMKGSTGTSYMNNETSGGIIKFIATNGDFGKITAFDGSDSEHTFIQIVASKEDKSKLAKLNFTVEGAYYSKTSGATAIPDNELVVKKDLTDINTKLGEIDTHKADTDVHTTVEEKEGWNDKYTKAEVDATLALKADQTSVDTALALKADTETVNEELSKKANQSDVEASLLLKADKTEFTEQLELKADKSEVTEQLNLKADKTVLEAHINDVTKHLGTISGENGSSLLFNEADGGGMRFTKTDGSGSLIAINDGTNNVYAQINAHTKDKAKIVRLNVNPDGLYYTKNASDNTVTADNELVTKADTDLLATKEEVNAIDERVQTLEEVTVDQLYDAGSQRAQSGTAVAQAVYDLATKEEVALKADQTAVDEITAKIPAEASAENQLADKSYVADMIRKGTAHFRGSWKTFADVPSDPTQYPEDVDGNTTPLQNDYLLVLEDETHEGHTWEYRYSGEWASNTKDGWTAIYEISDSPLTQAQLDAMNSGITAELVGQISQKANQSDLDTLGGRVDALEGVTVDQTYNAESTNAQSGIAVAQAIYNQRVIEASGNTAYMSNETSGGVIKFTKSTGEFGKVTLFDGSDSEGTYVQIVASNQDKSNLAKLNFTLSGAYYSKESGGAVAVADNELVTKKDIKDFASNSLVTELGDRVTAVESKEEASVDQTYDAESTNPQSGAAVAEAIKDFATKTELSTHTGNTDIHVTGADKTKWDGQSTIITEIQSTLTQHTGDTTAHITAEDRAKLDDLYTKTEVDSSFALKADMSSLMAGLELKADKDFVESALEAKADQTVMESAIASKADQSTLDGEVKTLTESIDTKAAQTDLAALQKTVEALQAKVTELETKVNGGA